MLITVPAQAQQVTIAALGDSLTQGYGLVPELGFVPQLEAWLEAQGEEVEILNAGVSGDTTSGGLARIGWTLTPEIDAVIVALGGNDLLRGIDPDLVRDNLDGILREVTARDLPVLLVGMVSTGNYGPDYKAAFDAVYPDLAARYGAGYVPDFLGALTSQEDRAQAIRRYMQGDGIHPNADGVALIVEDLGPAVRDLAARARD